MTIEIDRAADTCESSLPEAWPKRAAARNGAAPGSGADRARWRAMASERDGALAWMALRWLGEYSEAWAGHAAEAGASAPSELGPFRIRARRGPARLPACAQAQADAVGGSVAVRLAAPGLEGEAERPVAGQPEPPAEADPALRLGRRQPGVGRPGEPAPADGQPVADLRREPRRVVRLGPWHQRGGVPRASTPQARRPGAGAAARSR